MRILWVCNTMLPVVARHFNIEASNKEGWLSGLCDVVQEKKQENGIELALAFPVSKDMQVWREPVLIKQGRVLCYGFGEDTTCPENYDQNLKEILLKIAEDFQPDVIHCFGTEYPHTCAICEAVPDKSKLLISIQGLCSVYADAYYADLPKKVIERSTLRDLLKKDSIVEQREKFVKRGLNEQRAIRAAGNISGRTAWDEYYANAWNPEAKYYAMNETLRAEFYEGEWNKEHCMPYSIFLSQGDYPIKGLHYMLLALPLIRKEYPGVKVYVAGNGVAKYETLVQKLKISSYGKYILELLKKHHLEEQVVFLGKLNAQQMKEQYLKSHLFVCCSSIENSPNSLGEAMLLGMPCVSAKVGGVASIFTAGEDGILCEGYKTANSLFDSMLYGNAVQEHSLEKVVKSLADAVIDMWKHEEKMLEYCRNARAHAIKTHDREKNYRRMQEIYADIIAKNS